MTDPETPHTNPAGPCAMCGNTGPKGLFDTPGRMLVCAACLDDVTGESAAHGYPRPTR